MRPSGVAVVAYFSEQYKLADKVSKHWRFLFCFHNLASLLFGAIGAGVLSRYRIVLDANTRSIKKEMSDD